MRQIGIIPQESDAKRLADYLLTLNITTRLDPTKEGWAVWVHREERVEEARKAFQEFIENPADAKYQGLEQTARTIRKEVERKQREHLKNTINLRGRWEFRPAGRCPLTLCLVGISVIVAIMTELGARYEPVTARLMITEMRQVLVPVPVSDEDIHRIEPRFQPSWEVARTLPEVRRGEVWRLITPIFLHFRVLHILFNMLWLYDVGGLIELRKGSAFLAFVVLVSGVVSNLGQFYFAHSPFFGGMSGVVYALFGYVWIKSRYEPAGGMYLNPNTATLMMLWLAAGMLNLIPGMANAAHAVGLAVGVLIGFAPHARDELRRW